MFAGELRTLSAGLVRHEAGRLETATIDTLGRPTLMEGSRPDYGEVFGGMPTTYSLSGKEGAVEDFFTKLDGAGVMDHPYENGNLMGPPFTDVAEGQSALVANRSDGSSYHLVFDSAKPPNSVADALAALRSITDEAHLHGPDATGGAAGGFA
ncbi:MAG: hypothetical protein JWM98_1584 [Thermoleophilia bacterium]|nr:hypothetical protein [Thermoleophilia bacterium]